MFLVAQSLTQPVAKTWADIFIFKTYLEYNIDLQLVCTMFFGGDPVVSKYSTNAAFSK